MSIGSLTLDFLHSRYKCTTVLLTKISPVAALPVNPKRPTLMKASFQRADLFVFTDFVGGLISFLCVSISLAKKAQKILLGIEQDQV